jgi:hypothetical protein
MHMAEQETVIAESSPATEEQVSPNPMESWTDEQRSKWLGTGETPENPEETNSDESPQAEESATSTSEPEETPAETGSGSEPGKAQEPEIPKGSAAAQRIQQLLSERKQLEQRLAALEQPPAKELEAPKRPDPDDFRTQDEYDAAEEKYEKDKIAFAIQADRKEREEARSREEAEKRNQEIVGTYNKRIEEAKKRHPDFEKVALHNEALDAIPEGSPLYQAIVLRERGAEVLYHLGKHPEALESMLAGTAMDAMAEYFRIESSLGTTPAPRRLTGAPAPPRSVGGRATAPEDDAAAAVINGDFEAYQRVENQKEARRRGLL